MLYLALTGYALKKLLLQSRLTDHLHTEERSPEVLASVPILLWFYSYYTWQKGFICLSQRFFYFCQEMGKVSLNGMNSEKNSCCFRLLNVVH